jgi:ectoine hydroxylase-related dioxygenase (phytanoyl-CoA dioxygenase family)
MHTRATRATRSTLDRIADVPASEDAAAVAEARRRIEALFASRPPFAGRVKLLFGDDVGFIADGDRRSIEPLDGAADSDVHLGLDGLVRMIRGELDPRQALVFGDMVVQGGSVAAAVEFGDFLTGVPLAPPPGVADRAPQLTRDWSRARVDLEEHGYALVEGALSSGQLEQVRSRVVEQAAAERAAGKASIGESTQRIWNLVNKGRVFQDLLLNPLIDAFVPERIGQHALLHGAVAQIALPGNAPSIMHFDQIAVQPKVNFQIGLNFLWFLDDISDANGGTRIVPGSHRENVGPADPFDTKGTIAAAGPAGTALLLDSRVWHSVGRNITDQPRHLIATYFVRSYMRTQENYFLSLLPEVYAGLNEAVRVMLGFRCTGSLGGVEGPVEGKMVSWAESPIGELHRPAGS